MRSHRPSVWLVVALLAGSAACSWAQIQVVGSLTAQRSAKPGEVYEGTIALTNAGDAPEEAKIYQRDYFFFADGTVLYAEPSTEDSSNASWITFTPNLLTVPPKERAEVGYRVRVPTGAPLDGTYWSLILVEGVPKSRQAAEEEPERLTLNFRQVTRYAIQIVTNVPGAARPDVKFSNTRLLAEETGRTLQVDVENTGLLWTRPAFLVKLFDMLGKPVTELAQPARRIYPGTSIRVVFPLPQLAAGSYKALVVADGGNEDLFGANYTLKLGEAAPKERPAAKP